MRLAAEAGALTLDADKIVHYITDTNQEIQAAIAVAFGSHVRRPDGRINRAALGEIVFADPQAMRDLENILHPIVREETINTINTIDCSVIFIEAIKLLETGLADGCDQVWVTRCPAKRQLERLVLCRGMDLQMARGRIQAQPSQEEKIARADVVIDTNTTMAGTRQQFDSAWQRLSLPDPFVAFYPAPSYLPGGGAQAEPPTEEPTPEPKPEPTPEPVVEEKKAEPVVEKAVVAEKPAGSPPQTPKPTSPPAPEPDAEIVVRRARPADVPAVLLHIQRATDGAVRMKRAELLMALSERSYFIGQAGANISTIIGWHTGAMIARIDKFYLHPTDTALHTAPSVLHEIERSAKMHMNELIFGFVPNEGGEIMHQLLADAGFERRDYDKLHRVWKKAVDESQPDDTYIMFKMLRDIRYDKPGN